MYLLCSAQSSHKHLTIYSRPGFYRGEGCYPWIESQTDKCILYGAMAPNTSRTAIVVRYNGNIHSSSCYGHIYSTVRFTLSTGTQKPISDLDMCCSNNPRHAMVVSPMVIWSKEDT